MKRDLPRLYDTWVRMYHKAVSQGLSITEDPSPIPLLSNYRVQSASQPDIRYLVTVIADPFEGVFVVCDCQAGQHDIPCKHAALALRYEGYLPLPDGTFTLPHLYAVQ